MNKRELNGRLKTLAHNVASSDSVHLAMDEAFEEQKKALGLDEFVFSRIIYWNIELEINGIMYEGKKGSCHWEKGKELSK